MSRFLTSLRELAARWTAPGAWVTLGIFLLGRVLVQPWRDLPQFDEKGMDAFSCVETYRLRKRPEPFEVGVFGSSVAVWGIVQEELAAGLGRDPEQVRLLAVEGGTTFDTWNLIRRNETKYEKMRLALIEINPRELSEHLEGDPRLVLDFAQHATHSELMMLRHRADRVFYFGDELLPLHSFRRPLRSFYLNLTDPPPGDPVFPLINSRITPFDWLVPDPEQAVFHLKNPIPPQTAARRIAANWRVSSIMDHSLRQIMAWCAARQVQTVFYQMPVHHEVAALVMSDPRNAAGYAAYKDYLRQVGIVPPHFIETFSITDIGIPEKGLRDHTHLNQLGANTYSRHLGQQVRALLQHP
jgi:hypothetical protein